MGLNPYCYRIRAVFLCEECKSLISELTAPKMSHERDNIPVEFNQYALPRKKKEMI